MISAAGLPVLAYLVGSLPVSLWIARLSSGRDLREVGSGNPGATNVLRVAGRLPAAVALVGDAAKGALPVLLGQTLAIGEGYVALSALTAVLGHVFSPLMRFRGGKGVATAFGGFLVLAPLVTVCALTLFILLVCWHRYVSLGSLVAVLGFPLIWLVLGMLGLYHSPAAPVLASSLAVGLLVVWRHADNIRRLRGGRESRIGYRVGGDSSEVGP